MFHHLLLLASSYSYADVALFSRRAGPKVAEEDPPGEP